MDGEPSKKKKRENKPTCRLCKNHNLKILSSGHKEHCPGQHCICEKCNDQKEEREKTANETKKSRAEKQEIERQERIKLNGSELVKFEAEKDIIPFIIPEKYKDRLQNSIDKEVFKYIDFKKEMLISFEVQKGKKRKANIKEEESNEKITTLLNEDLLQHTLLCLCSCLGYDIRYTTILSWTIKKIVAIFCEYPGEEEKNSEDVKRRISLASIIRHMKIIRQTITWNIRLSHPEANKKRPKALKKVCQETVHKLMESHRKCLQENPQCADMYRDQYLFNGINFVNQKVDWRLENYKKCLQENSVQYSDMYNSLQCTYMNRAQYSFNGINLNVNQEVDRMEQYRKCLQENSVHCTDNIYSSVQSTDMYRAHCLLNGETSQNLFWPLLLNYTSLSKKRPCTDNLPKPSTEHPSYKPNTDI